jgi:hypothetical protein
MNIQRSLAMFFLWLAHKIDGDWIHSLVTARKEKEVDAKTTDQTKTEHQ